MPEFLAGRCTPETYYAWLETKAVTHSRRDRKRGHLSAGREAYMVAIHNAVQRSKGFDEYTGEPLAWEKIKTYENAASKAGGREYKKSFWNLPTIDHCGDDLTKNEFRICSLRTNDCKSDLSDDELIEFCETVLAYSNKDEVP